MNEKEYKARKTIIPIKTQSEITHILSLVDIICIPIFATLLRRAAFYSSVEIKGNW